MTEDKTREKIAEHRDELDALADSNLPANWIAEALIQVEDSSSPSGSQEEDQ